MAELGLNRGSPLSTPLRSMLSCDALQIGDAPSYAMCKTIYEFHPLGAKMVDSPIRMAQSVPRKITVSKGPEERVREQFEKQWKSDHCNSAIAQLARTARMYGVATLALLIKGTQPGTPLDLQSLINKPIAFSIFDPLNTAGSLVLNQQPNAFDFMKVEGGVMVQGSEYHKSRVCVLMNEQPIYLGWTSSAFGFSGRSVYQRALYPLKSFLQTMVANDMISRKAGVIVAKVNNGGSIVDNIMQWANAVKRNFVKEAETDNVIAIGTEGEEIESLDMTNVSEPFTVARKNILEDIATANDMPALLLNAETFAEGFGEGTEDAKHVAEYIDTIREWMQPAYDWLDLVTQYRAWTPAFYASVQKEFPEEYGKVDFDEAFQEWANSFEATWPSLMREPESEKVKIEKTKLEGLVQYAEVLLPVLDPENKARMVQCLADNFNEMKELFPVPMEFDIEELADYVPPMPLPGEDGAEPAAGGGGLPKPQKPSFGRADSRKMRRSDEDRRVRESAQAARALTIVAAE